MEPNEPNSVQTENQTDKRQQKPYSVTVYICLLFAVVIIVVLMSYFIQQRNNSRALLSLREQHDKVTSQAFENIEKLQEKNMELLNENDELNKKIDDLEARITELENAAEAAADENKSMKDEIKAVEQLLALKSAMAAGDTEKAKQLIEEITKETGSLPYNGKELFNELKAEYDELINSQGNEE